VRHWRDIWLNEGFATYMEVRYAETHGGPSGATWLRRVYRLYDADDSFWRVSLADPGSGKIFDGAVYQRGAMTLQALRNVIGDRTFSQLLRTWVAQRRNGNGATTDFHTLAEQLSGQDLDAFFDAWLVATVKPADTAANGLG
jgi:aminopeptidase N